MKDLLIVVIVAAAIAAGLFVARRFVEKPAGEVGRDVAAEAVNDGDPIGAAWSLVHERPKDAAAWAALGEAQAAADQLDSAEHSYRTAILLGGGDGLAYARLGFLLYARGEDGQARALLSEAKRRGADVPMLDYTLKALASSKAPAAGDSPVAVRDEAPAELDAGLAPLDASVTEPLRARRICTVEAERRGQGHTFLLPVQIGGETARLVIDTGASITLITSDLASRIGVPLDRERIIRAFTANGRADFSTAVLPVVELGGRTAQSTRVAVCSDCVEGFADGLLGLDLQAAFGLELDLGAGEVRFSDCRE